MISWRYNCINEDILGIYMGFNHQQGYLWDFKQSGTQARTGEWTPWTSWTSHDDVEAAEIREVQGPRFYKRMLSHALRENQLHCVPIAQCAGSAACLGHGGLWLDSGAWHPNATAFLWGTLLGLASLASGGRNGSNVGPCYVWAIVPNVGYLAGQATWAAVEPSRRVRRHTAHALLERASIQEISI